MNSLILKIAIIDAFFCQGIKTPTNIIIKPAIDFTAEKSPYATPCTNKRQFHGQQVLNNFIKNLKTKNQLEIYPYKVFKKNGDQDPAALTSTLKDIENKKIDVTIMAIGFFHPEVLPQKLPTLTFAASGASGNGVESNSNLWPQELIDDNLILISHYFPSVTSSKSSLKGHFDPSSLYLNKTRFFVKNPPNTHEFSGSSYAVSFAAGKAVSSCSPPKNIKTCLEKITSALTIISKPTGKNYRTF